MTSRSLIHSTEYYLIFTQGVTHWITRWLKPNFSHIWLLTRDDYNWLILNPTRLYLQPLIPPISVIDNPWPALLRQDDTVIHIRFGRRDDTQQFGAIGFLNCVTWAKYILGLRIRCLTPFGLYKRLINLCPSEKETHSILSITELQHDWTRDAVEQRSIRNAEGRPSQSA